MANKYLTREAAPIDAKTWEILDKVMIEATKGYLSARKLLNVEGPYGLGLKVVPMSDPSLENGISTSPSLSLALLHSSFTLGKRDIAAFERDGIMLDASAVYAAAIECAKLEDTLIFEGQDEIPGLLTVKGAGKLKLSEWSQIGSAADDIIKAVSVLDGTGFHGPYALALSTDLYNLLLRRYPNNNLSELDHVKTITTEGVFKAPAIENGGVLIASGRQYASIIIGQDMAIGFIGPVAEKIEFSISESLVPFIRQPESVCILTE